MPGREERIALNGSPFVIQVAAGLPTAQRSYVDGYSKETKNQEQQKKRSPAEQQLLADASSVFAGDTVSARPFLLDAYGNPTFPSDDGHADLTGRAAYPDGSEMELLVAYDTKNRRYDVRMDTTLTGKHQMHLLLCGQPIQGSPLAFSVVDAYPDVRLTRRMLYHALAIPAVEACLRLIAHACS